MEQASAAPTPASFSTRKASSTLLVASSARVTKCRAADGEGETRLYIYKSVDLRYSLTCLAAAQQFRANRVDAKHKSMMIVAHGVARQVSCIAEGHKVLLPHIVLALRLVVDNMRHNKVIMIQRLRQRILGVAQYALHPTEID